VHRAPFLPETSPISGTAQKLTARCIYELHLALLVSCLNVDGNRIPPHHAASRLTPLKSVILHRIPPYHASRIGLRIRRSQVRVLPSALQKCLQRRDFFLSSCLCHAQGHAERKESTQAFPKIAKPAPPLPTTEYLPNPATCSVLYRAPMGHNRRLGPVLSHNDAGAE
jgi:hypothetical protein